MKYDWERIGKNIQRLREAALMTRFKLAKKTGICPTALGYIETAKSGARFSTVIKIADTLGCKVDDFLTGVRK